MLGSRSVPSNRAASAHEGKQQLLWRTGRATAPCGRRERARRGQALRRHPHCQQAHLARARVYEVSGSPVLGCQRASDMALIQGEHAGAVSVSGTRCAAGGQ